MKFAVVITTTPWCHKMIYAAVDIIPAFWDSGLKLLNDDLIKDKETLFFYIQKSDFF